MTILVFPGDFGEFFWERIKDGLDLLRAGPRIRELTGADRERATVELIAWLARAGFGDDEVEANGFESRLAYFEDLQRRNPNVLRLLPSDGEIVIRIAGRRTSRMIRVGFAAGYTAVMPITREGFVNYLTNRTSQFRLGAHVLPADAADESRTHYHIEGLFHLPTMGRQAESRGRGGSLGVVPSSAGLFHQLASYLRDLLPELRFVPDANAVNRRVFTTARGPLSCFSAEANGAIGTRMLSRLEFRPPSLVFPELSPIDETIEGHPRFVLDSSRIPPEALDPRGFHPLGLLSSFIIRPRSEAGPVGTGRRERPATPLGAGH